ncbi:MAG: hypothetical protein KFW07_01275 [Mycoplasmataceae bacterium]|nr:hypothetical protein [Mycoplasmataceae bacterium]
MLDNIEVKKLILKFPKLSNNLIEKDILSGDKIFTKISDKEKHLSTPLSQINLFREDFFTLENKKV